MPAPRGLTHFWSFGSLLGATLGLQIARGLMLAASYRASQEEAFVSVIAITIEQGYG